MYRRHPPTPALIALGLVVCVAVAGCGREPDLVVLCGSSFVPPTEALIAEFRKQNPGVRIEMTAAGSEDFLPHVKMKDQGSILVTHDPYLDETRKAGALSDSAHVGFVAPVLTVQKGNPKGFTKIEDLATKPNIKVALSNPQYSTCGEMVRDLLKKKGIYDDVMKNVGNRLTKGHDKLGTFLKLKTVDAVIMWNGVASMFQDSLDVVRTPYEYDNEIRVHVIGLNYAPNQDVVQRFIDFAKKNGTRIFSEHGYVK